MRPEELPAAMQRAIDDFKNPTALLEKVASVVEGNAKRRVRMKTGNLQRSIGYRIEGKEAYVGSGVEYAPYVEARYPYLAPAIEDAVSQAQSYLQDYGDKALAKVGGA